VPVPLVQACYACVFRGVGDVGRAFMHCAFVEVASMCM
jgi:hypothetical protein